MPHSTRMLMATDCQKVKKTTDLTTMNLDNGRMGASSSWQARYIRIRQYSAHICSSPNAQHKVQALLQS